MFEESVSGGAVVGVVLSKSVLLPRLDVYIKGIT